MDRARDLDRLQRQVVEGGYCIGCGVCVAALGPGSAMQLDEHGCYRPRWPAAAARSEGHIALWEVCPFGGAAASEDDLAAELFGQDSSRDDSIGYHAAVYAGAVRADAYRRCGSSGGMASWVLCELLRQGHIDGVVHVQPHVPEAPDVRLFRYAVSRTEEEVQAGAKSRYYPVELSEVIRTVRREPGRYALIGLPCFVKAVRLLCKADRVVSERLPYYIGLVCGHLKSARFADLFAWQCGIEPGNLSSIDFRVKLPDRKAYDYGVELVGRREGCEARVVKPAADFFGSPWGYGLLKYPACDYCDDVFAEVADLTVGDAWLPPYFDDARGTNVVVARTRELAELLDKARAHGRLELHPLSAAEAARSQRAGLRHRRAGTAYRLLLKEQVGQWHPPKRLSPAESHLDARRRRIFDLRLQLATESHEAFLAAVGAGRFEVFRERMTPLIEAYELCYRKERGLRGLLSKVKRKMASAARVLRRGPEGSGPQDDREQAKD